MPRRKRIDPSVSGPIDGDYDRLRVLNKDKSLDYAWCDADDEARLKMEGYSVVGRREGGEKPAFDIGGHEGEALRVGGLTLLAAPIAIKKRIDARSQAEDNNRRIEMQSQVKKMGGSLTEHVTRHVA